MSHQTTKRFRDAYDCLNSDTKKLADKAFEMLKTNPSHPSLQFKKIGQFYSVRIDLTHRALAVKDSTDYIWVWIGNHSDYERLIK